MMGVMIILGVLVVIMNTLDSVSTHLGLNLPKDIRAEEGNFLMTSIMKGDYLISEIIKHLGVVLLVVVWVYFKKLDYLLIFLIMLGLVVFNNFYIYVTRKIYKRKIATPFSPIARVLKIVKIPSWLQYLIIIAIFYIFAVWVTSMILGG